MNRNIRKAYAEIFEILNVLDKEYVDKIPNSFIENIKKEKDDNHKISIDPNIPLENQNLLEDTINILAVLKLKYWCEDQEEKQKLINILNNNENMYKKD